MSTATLPSIVDIGGIYRCSAFTSCVFVFSKPQAFRVCGELGIIEETKGILKRTKSFRQFSDLPFSWTGLSGADIDGKAFFDHLENPKSTPDTQLPVDVFSKLHRWHEDVIGNYIGWYTITTFHRSWDPLEYEYGLSIINKIKLAFEQRVVKDDHKINFTTEPEFIALALRNCLGNVGFLLNVPILLEKLKAPKPDLQFIIGPIETVKRAQAYKQQCKKLKGQPFRFGAHLSFEEFDSLSPAAVPGAIGNKKWLESDPEFLENFPALKHTIDQGVIAQPVLLPRHFLMSQDEKIWGDELLDFGRLSCNYFTQFRENSILKCCPKDWKSGYTSKVSKVWRSSNGLLFFMPRWLFRMLFAAYSGKRFSQALRQAKSELLGKVTPIRPSHAKGRLHGSDLKAMTDLKIPDTEDMRFLLKAQPSLSELARNSEEDGEYLPKDFLWFLSNLDASFIIYVLREEITAYSDDESLNELQINIMNIIREHIMLVLAQCKKNHDAVYLINLVKRSNWIEKISTNDLMDDYNHACHLLIKGFSMSLTALAYRYALEGAGFLATANEPPYPVAVWSEQWIISQWKRFAYSHGLRLAKGIQIKHAQWHGIESVSQADRVFSKESSDRAAEILGKKHNDDMD